MKRLSRHFRFFALKRIAKSLIRSSSLSNEDITDFLSVSIYLGCQGGAFTWWTMGANSPPAQQPTGPTTTRKSKVLQLHLLTDSEGVVRQSSLPLFRQDKLKQNWNKSKIGQPAPFTLIREDRNINKGGGLAFLIHESIQFIRLDKSTLNDDTLEYLAIQVEDLKLIYIKIPPGSSCSTGYKPSLNSVFPDGDAIIMGDLNAHDNLWHSSIQDARGSDLADEIGSSNFGTLNTEHHTRRPAFNRQATSPDVTLASLSILPYASWQAHTNLGSDHLPLLISLDTDMTHQPSEDKVSEKQTGLNSRLKLKTNSRIPNRRPQSWKAIQKNPKQYSQHMHPKR